jgi:hypothetical protein
MAGLMVYNSIHLMVSIPIGIELIISCDFLIPNFMKLFQGSIYIGNKVRHMKILQ